MEMRKMAAGLIATAVALVTSSAFGAAWVPPNGATSTFTYAAGGDDFGKFGSPVDVTDEGFYFEPAGFVATAFGGVTTSSSLSSDRMYVTVAALGGAKNIVQVKLNELGDFTINNGGGVKAYAWLSVRILDSDYVGTKVFYADDTFTNDSAGNAQGSWTLDPVVTLPTGVNRIQIVLNNNLQAYSAANGTALIQKKLLGGPDDPGITIVLPEPTTLTALAGLSLIGLRRRKA
jgi:hypothetical protein